MTTANDEGTPMAPNGDGTNRFTTQERNAIQPDPFFQKWCDERHARLDMAIAEATKTNMSQALEIQGVRADVQALAVEIRGLVKAIKEAPSKTEATLLRKLLPWIAALLIGGGAGAGISGLKIQVVPDDAPAATPAPASPKTLPPAP